MALAAADGQAEPYGPGRIHAINHRFMAELLFVGAAFLVNQCVAVKRRRHALALRRIGKQIASKLFDRKLIKRHVVVEALMTQSR